MRQTLFYIPHEIAGIPVFGAGWLLILWSLFGVGFFVWQSGRRGFKEAGRLVPFTLVVATAILILFPALEVSGLGLPIRGYGAMLLIAVLAGLAAATHRARQVGIESDQILSLALYWMFPAGIVGARLFYVLQYWRYIRRESFHETLLSILKFTEGGLVVYGSLVGALTAFLLFSVRHRVPVPRLADVVVPAMVLGLAIGRLGCLLNGCCFGGVCEAGPIAITFPRFSAPEMKTLSPAYGHQLRLGQLHGIRIDAHRSDQTPTVAEVRAGSAAAQAGVEVGQRIEAMNGQPVRGSGDIGQLLSAAGPEIQLTTAEGVTFRWRVPRLPPRSLPVHPTQLYSSLNAALIFALAWFYFPYRRREGEVCGLVLTIYPITRFLLEWVRVDESARFGTELTISQLVSLLVLVAMVPFWMWARGQPPLPSAADPKRAF